MEKSKELVKNNRFFVPNGIFPFHIFFIAIILYGSYFRFSLAILQELSLLLQNHFLPLHYYPQLLLYRKFVNCSVYPEYTSCREKVDSLADILPALWLFLPWKPSTCTRLPLRLSKQPPLLFYCFTHSCFHFLLLIISIQTRKT